jgi:hypothetical protein
MLKTNQTIILSRQARDSRWEINQIEVLMSSAGDGLMT